MYEYMSKGSLSELTELSAILSAFVPTFSTPSFISAKIIEGTDKNSSITHNKNEMILTDILRFDAYFFIQVILS